MMKQSLESQLKKKLQAGYTLDQTILVVAIIAILVTIIIATVGWELITRAGGSKFASQLKQVEDATGAFFAEHGRWPTQADSAVITAFSFFPIQAITAQTVALTDPDFIANVCNGASCTGIVTNRMPGIRYVGNTPVHGFGSGNTALDTVRMHQGTPPAASLLGTFTYILVNVRHVSRGEVLEADEKLDSALDAAIGRVLYRTHTAAEQDVCTLGGSTPSANAQYLDVCYIANLIE
ncbi:MAG: hypothetical protein WAX89_02450 [Alphaproteobacteria bacterium]